MTQTIENLDDVVDFSKITEDEKKEFVPNILKGRINIAKGNELWLVFFMSLRNLLSCAISIKLHKG